MHTLGIDFGSDKIGLAVLDRRSNSVLKLIELELRDDIKDRMEERRALRRHRRQRKRYRRPIEPDRQGGVRSAPPYRRACGQNRASTMKCMFVNPVTGEKCSLNAPLKKNIRRELMAITLKNSDIPPGLKDNLVSCFDRKRNPPLSTSDLMAQLRKWNAPSQTVRMVEQLLHGNLHGRSDYCRAHLHACAGDWTAERHSMPLSNSVLAKHSSLVSLLKKLSKYYNIDRVRIEDSNFDPELIRSGRLLDSGAGADRPDFLKKNTFKALQHEYLNRCCYCGRDGSSTRLEIEHVIPKSLGGSDTWENLVLACGDCNSRKGWRTPETAGMDFHVLEGVIVAGVPRRVSLEPVPFERSRTRGFMDKTDPGKRTVRKHLRQVFPLAEFEFDFGYRTSYLRNKWNWEKSRCCDAAVIAAMAGGEIPGAPPTIPLEKSVLKFNSGGGKLFDTFPVSKTGAGYVQGRTLISRDGRFARFTWGEIKRVASPGKKRILEKLKEKAGVGAVSDADLIPDDLLETLPFRRVTLKRKDVGASAVRGINGNYFKAEHPNWGTAVYLDKNGKKNFFMIKNARVFGKTQPPEDFARLLFIIRKGDRVKFTYKNRQRIEKVYANFSNGSLKLLTADGETIMKSAKSCVPAGGRDI